LISLSSLSFHHPSPPAISTLSLHDALPIYLTQQVVVGDRLELRGPLGGWFVWRTEQTEPIQLIAGGSGLVPLMAMIRSRAAAGSSAPFRLLYSVREPGAVFYRDELRKRSENDRS